MEAKIKAIDVDSVHRLHSGQVVLELQQAIKELVENSLDAGASSIDVRIKDNGLDTLEVSDNGSGIAEADWPFIGMKHHTSKLAAISHLPNVTTFGFRGEALSALCSLCESVVVTTSTKETTPMGAVIKLGRDGRVIDSSQRLARTRGTTITLSGLFVPLPVRRKEFERNAKREFTKALTLLYAYALVPSSVSSSDGRTGVRLRVEAIAAGKAGKRTTLLSTDGRGSLRTSVSSVWGPKALDGVQDVSLALDVDVDSMMARREGVSRKTQTVKVSGLISSAAWGQGRSSADRQFYYVNGRPCDLRQVGKAINEVYKSFNTNQVPLAILDFQIPPESIDINVSPDKRTIFLHSEANMIIALRAALEAFFQPSRSAYVVEGASHNIRALKENIREVHRQTTLFDDEAKEDEDELESIPQRTSPEPSGPPLRRSGSRRIQEQITVLDEDEEDESSVSHNIRQRASTNGSSSQLRSTQPSSSRPVISQVGSLSRSGISSKRVSSTLDTTSASWSPERKPAGAKRGREARASLRERLKGYASQAADVTMKDDELEQTSASEDDVENDDTTVDGLATDLAEDTEVEEEARPTDDIDELDEDENEHVPVGDDDMNGSEVEPATPGPAEISPILESPVRAGEIPQGVSERATCRPSEPIFEDELPSSPSPHPDSPVARPAASPSRPTLGESSRTPSAFRDEIPSTGPSGEMTLAFNLPRLCERYATKSSSSTLDRTPRDAYSRLMEGGVSSAAGIGNRNATSAEEALNRVISKDDFARMEILGQFNKGFIIARLRNDLDLDLKGKAKTEVDDLFIIDQHACDEKFNFETLQRTTTIKAQQLIKPRPLQLTAGDEITAMESLDVLRINGFDVEIDEDAAPGRGERVKLTAMPVSKETVFDFKDLEQLLHLLSDSSRPSGTMVRCTKARSMFAMRACRKSVMIGKSLNKGQMTQLVRNMGTIDQPWNCPHGRPTMRHLTKIQGGGGTKSHSRINDRIDWIKWSVSTTVV
ncbi:hypothetical protein BCR39DRAFT_501064 [Naematelia encephala]|uniref:DNA mismatch repair protein MutL n=1 Tax=Naematelia encephala TaxID=71784 RepID=A0A1Y2AL29_9TREE|nr:hypothetical protein BCR39DRAFT_501064 [Naematelia encephala]